jgi:glutamate synthase (NADPH/NADH) small chain
MPITADLEMSIDRKGRAHLPPQERPLRDPEVRINDFREVKLAFDEEAIQAEAARCIHCPDPAPCVTACPLDNDIPTITWFIEEGDYLGAAALYRSKSPLPEICSRVCPQEHLCEGSCTLGSKGKAIACGMLERFVTDFERETVGVALPQKAPSSGKRVALVGSGPAGMACAEKLAVAGHEVVVYEVWPEPGGLLLYGIPSFKVEKELIKSKTDWLRDLGVQFVCNTRVGEDITVSEIMAQGADAVFLGVGAGIEATMDVPGEDLEAVFRSTDFLVRGNLDPAILPEDRRDLPHTGERVAVIGGGDTATDCLRTALRLGASEVVCYYRRTEREMPGSKKELKLALDEGVKVLYLTAPTEFLDKSGDGRVDTMILINMELGEPDDSGRRRPVPIEGSEHEIPVDSVILAIGYWPDPLMGETTPDLETHNWGLISADSETGSTSLAGIYAGGDAVTGPDLVVTAAAAGMRAAESIHRHLTQGELVNA